MVNAKIVRLIQVLAEKSTAGTVNWTATEIEGVFQAAFTDYGVRTFYRPTRLEARGTDYVLALYNSSGELIEEYADVDFGEDFPDSYVVMMGLYNDARRKALGVDDAVDRILNQLENDDLV